MIDCAECEAYCCKVLKCDHLTDNNKCNIYDSRPFVCNTDSMYEKIYSKNMTREEFNVLNTNACKELKMQSGKISSTMTIKDLNDFIISKHIV